MQGIHCILDRTLIGLVCFTEFGQNLDRVFTVFWPIISLNFDRGSLD
jgi:hypothetical protein